MLNQIEVANAYASGLSLRAVAARFGCSMQRVHQIVSERGIIRRTSEPWSPGGTGPSNPDGRRLRPVKTRAKIIEAIRDLGVLEASASAVAKRARVSIRSIFQHYDSMAELRFAAMTEAEVFRLAGSIRVLSDADLVRKFLAGEAP